MSHAVDNAIEVQGLECRQGERTILHDVAFTVARGELFFVIGGSGCGKSTLFRNMTGLVEPLRGDVLYEGRSFTTASLDERDVMLRRMGVLYQQGALWSSLTLAENIALPLQQYTTLGPREIEEIIELKLSLVGLRGFGDFSPGEISGGMRKRAALARAMALDPEILFFDEPSAGLDPISSKLLDDLIVELSQSLGATVVVVTHELASLFAIGTNGVFLDAETRTMAATGSPREMLERSENPNVRAFLTRGGSGAPVGGAR